MINGNRNAADRDSRSARLDLSPALEIAGGKEAGWTENDFGEILCHQLDTPLVVDLGVEAQKEINTTGYGPSDRVPTFRDLLFGPSPPLALLVQAKDFAKAADCGNTPSLPTKVALVLYHALIAAALLQHNRRISSLSQVELEEGFTWLTNQSWSGQQLAKLGMKAIDALRRKR